MVQKYKITLPSVSRGSVVLENFSLTILKYWISDYVKFNRDAFEILSTNEYKIIGTFTEVDVVITRNIDVCCVSFGRPIKKSTTTN